MKEARAYLCIDLKSFFASAECRARGLDPMTTHLVVADESRTEKTICLAVTPPLKALGVPGRARLFEAVEKVTQINEIRRRYAPGWRFSGASSDSVELAADPSLALEYIVAAPRMALYMQLSTEIYSIYLRYIAPEDIHVYSIDEVFIDVTGYLKTYRLSARELAKRMICDVFEATGITAAAGIGTNMYLAKVAMDIWAKRVKADRDGVRIAELDEASYRRLLWDHRPLRDFWRVGHGYAQKLESVGIFTMGDIARCSLGGKRDLHNEDLLYRLFGVNAELLIDHAWGWEPCTIADIKAYRPRATSVGSGQVLTCPYEFDKGRIVVREMAEALALELVAKGITTDQIVLTVGYDIENLSDPTRRKAYKGTVVTDVYGRRIPKAAHGTRRMQRNSSTAMIVAAVLDIYDKTVQPALLLRRFQLVAEHTARAAPAMSQQLDLFTDYAGFRQEWQRESRLLAGEKKLQMAMLEIRQKYGKNAILKGCSLMEGATAMQRNQQIGGHKA